MHVCSDILAESYNNFARLFVCVSLAKLIERKLSFQKEHIFLLKENLLKENFPTKTNLVSLKENFPSKKNFELLIKKRESHSYSALILP
jgi:hypothetical protein